MFVFGCVVLVLLLIIALAARINQVSEAEIRTIRIPNYQFEPTLRDHSIGQDSVTTSLKDGTDEKPDTPLRDDSE
jgi:hypothetical protein